MADARKLERTKTPGIFKRGNRYVVIERDARGKQVKRFAETLAHARDVKAELRADIKRGEHRASSRTSFIEYAEQWAENYAGRTSRKIKEQTRKDYIAAIARDEFQDYFRNLRLNEVEPEHLEKYGAALQKQGLTPRTVRNLLLPVRLCLATARDRGHLRANPAAGVKVSAALGAGPKQDELRALTNEEIAALLEAFDAVARDENTSERLRAHVPTHRLLAEFLLQTGCRIGEALALTWADFSPDLSTVTITRRRYKGTTDTPKSRYGVRTIPISPELRRRLKRHKSDAADIAPVFCSSIGTPLDYYAARRVFRAAADKAELPWAGFHTLRHTCASVLFKPPGSGGLGASAKQVQLWLGHHSPAFTLATYVHLMPSDLPDPAGFDHLFGATNGATEATETGRKRTRASRAKMPVNR